ncbi:unnamed protein product [Cuscuta epithymum]|uniref:Polygalacturonase n=1 Tax=Cuscuta epithymum TaxID=186058 RepID=A0AAV0DB18_9ASTE|nr:unnamed protein product [Cuscuta epithymum]
MKAFSFRSLTTSVVIMVALLVWSSSTSCHGRRHWRATRGATSPSLYKYIGGGKHQHGNAAGKPKHKHYAPPPPSPTPPPSSDDNDSSVFNVLDFGAKGDGETDDTKAFQATWGAACKVEASKVMVPSEHVFLVGPTSFSGPYCQHNIVFQLDGTIIAPTDSKAWGSGLFQWLQFTKLVGLTIKGSGTIDGSGSVWWQNRPLDDLRDHEMKLNPEEKGSLGGEMPTLKPTLQALRFYGSFNVTVTGITIQNSPQCHLKFDDCAGVYVYNFTASSPGDSPNTDGIHLQNSKDVLVHSSNLACAYEIGELLVISHERSGEIYHHQDLFKGFSSV